MQRKILSAIFILLFLAAGIYWFLYTKEARTPVNDGINAIPADAAVIFESKQASGTWKKLSQTNIMWEELMGTETFANINLQAHSVDSILQLDPLVLPLLDEHSVYISAHANKDKTLSFLFIYTLPNLTYSGKVEEFLAKVNGKEISYSDFENEKIGTLLISDKPPVYFALVSGTLILSTNTALVKSSIQRLASKISFASDKNFSKVFNTAGKKVDATIYVNYKNFPAILERFTSAGIQTNTHAIADFADCSGWDATIKPNSLMLSGFTYANDSTGNFLSIFNRQKPEAIELTSIIPSRTALLMFYGISNMPAFQRDHKKYLQATSQLAAYENFCSSINKKYGTDIENKMFSWPDNEMGLIVTEPSSTDLTENSFAVFHSGDIENALKQLDELSGSISGAANEKADTSGFRGHVIAHLNIQDLLPALFGIQFSKVSESYYTSINDYIIFGNTRNALQEFINDFENNKTLANDKNYLAFSENISAEANIYIYTSIARSTDIYKTFLNPSNIKDIDRKLDLFHKFGSAAIQFSSGNKLFYSNIFLKYNPEYKKESGTLWESKLDTTLNSKPYLVINHNTKAKEVLVQDDANKIYLISNTGKVIWTKQLHEKIMSDVIQLDVLKNNKLQMVFNTRSFIYMFDRNGNDMKGFPLKLASPATNAIAVVDYENNKEYRIFIACENKKILGYKPDGEPVNGFNPGKTKENVYLPVQYFNAAGKDHLCVIDAKGKIYILDRHGDIRVKMKEEMSQGIRAFYVEAGKDYSKTFITAADTLGNVMRVSLAGDREKIKLQNFETSPFFEYRDINNDKTKEFIFLTRRQLKVFNPDKSLLFSYEFKSDITQPLQVFQFPDGSARIGVVSEASNELFLFNNTGTLYNSFPLNGRTLFSIGDLNNEGIYDLVSGSADHSIYVYQLH